MVTVGTFDGVHIGHQALLGKAVELAAASDVGATSVAVTFIRPPRTVLRPDPEFAFLCALEEREKLIRDIGIDVVVPLEFDDSVRNVTAREFATLLTDILRLEHFVSGPGSAVGRDRSGDPDAMRDLGEELGFQVHSVSPEIYNGDAVSSSLVRTALAGGRMGEVAGMLGRRYTIFGPVAEGQRRGRELGFPTANVSVGEPGYPIALPADGIYATWATLEDGRKMMAATSIGLRPQFEEHGPRTVEAYLMDFDADIYTQALSLEFVRRLRPEEKFSDVDGLVTQMKKDVESARSVLERDLARSSANGQ